MCLSPEANGVYLRVVEILKKVSKTSNTGLRFVGLFSLKDKYGIGDSEVRHMISHCVIFLREEGLTDHEINILSSEIGVENTRV